MSVLLQSPRPPATTEPRRDAPPQPHPLAVLAAGTCLYVALLAGLASLNGVVEGFGWLFTTWFPLLLVHGAGALVRGSRWPNWLAAPAAAMVVVLLLLFHPALQNPALGEGPLQRLGWMLDTAGLEFATQVPEVAYTRAVDFTFLLLGLALALLVELLASARRLAGLVVLPLSFAPVLASLFKPQGAGIGYLAVILVALVLYFALLPYAWPGRESVLRLPSRRRLSATGLLAGASVLALLAASAWVPGFRQGMLPEGSRPSGQLFASNLDPLLSLGRDLRGNNTATTLTYFTSADSAPYLRTQVITNLNAVRWEPDQDPLQYDYRGTTALRSEFMSFGAASELTQIRWENVPSDRQLPLPAHSYLVEGIAGPWHWQPQTSTAEFTTESRQATSAIRISHSVPTVDLPAARRMAFLDQLPASLDPSLSELPSGADAQLRELLATNLQQAYGSAGEPATAVDRAVAIQDYLRSTRFSYSEQTPLREGYDGANLRVVAAFLERRAGYCVHFASTMALMARAAGIPSRVVVGYAPGEPLAETLTVRADPGVLQGGAGDAAEVELAGYRVSGQQAHAWPELYLPGLGWTPFEPTPGRGVPPDYAPAAAPTEGLVEPEQLPEPLDDSTVSDPDGSTQQPVAAPETGARSSAFWPRLLGWIVVPLLLVAGTVPAVRRIRQRRTRLEAIHRGGATAARAVWEEVRAMGADHGHPMQPGQSEADYHAALADMLPESRTELAALQQVVEASFYALRHPHPGQARELSGDLHALRLALGRQAGFARRLRAVCWPASTTRTARGTATGGTASAAHRTGANAG